MSSYGAAGPPWYTKEYARATHPQELGQKEKEKKNLKNDFILSVYILSYDIYTTQTGYILSS